MSFIQKRLASYLLKEHFGDIADTVGTYLARRGARNLKDIVNDTKLKKEQVQKALCALIQHKLVSYEKNKKKITIYSAEVDNMILLLRYPRFQYIAKTIYGNIGELIIGELQQHGDMPLSLALDNILEHSEQTGFTESAIKEVFTKLVDGHFLRRVPIYDSEGIEGEMTEEMQYVLPAEVFGKRKRSVDDKEKPSKRLKTNDGMSVSSTSDLPDKDILWCVNSNRFHQMILEESIVTAVEKKFDSNATEIVKAILKKDESNRDPHSPTTCSSTLYEIAKSLPKSCRLENSSVSQYLSLMVDDQDKFVKKISDSGGGTYVIDIKKCVSALCQYTIQSILQERYGSDATRIFRLLLQKDHLEQKQIGELAMIPSKDAKELVYKLFGENVISMQEVAKTSDYAPSRTIYLFSVKLKQLTRTLLERCYQTVGNLMSRRQSEIQDHSRVLEKQERMEITINALKAQHGEEAAQICAQELEELVTEADREQLRKLKLKLDKLQQSELQVDDTIFILHQYITYYL